MTDTIKAVAEAIKTIGYKRVKHKTFYVMERQFEAEAKAAIEAYEKVNPPVKMVGAQCSCGKQMTITQGQIREMTVEDVALFFELEWRRATYLTLLEAAKALVKLGTIRIVDGK